MKMGRSGIGYMANKEKKFNNNKSQSQRSVLSVDKKATLPMSAKLHNHNPCPSMLDLLLSMLIICLGRILVEKLKLCS